MNQRVRAHVELFNAAQRAGAWVPFVAVFTDDAVMSFAGVPAGSHTLRATSGTGVTASHELELPVGETRWAVLEYWYDLDTGPRSFTFRVDDQPVGFD